MTTLDRYLFRRYLVVVAQCLAGLVGMYIFIDLVTHRQVAIARYDVPWAMVWSYYAHFTPKVVHQVAPLAMLVASLLVLGDMAQHNEITAALASGISLRRLTVVPILVAMACSCGLFALDTSVGAAATREALGIEKGYFSSRVDAADRRGVSWANLGNGWTCHIGKFNRLAMTGENILMSSIREDAVEQIEANRVYWDEEAGHWLIEDGHWFTFDAAASTRRVARRITQTPAPFAESPAELFAEDAPADGKTASELARDVAFVEARAMPSGRLRTDFYAKYSWPALTFVMLGLAIPFAARQRRGGVAASFGTSIVIALAYLTIFYASMSLGHAERVSPLVAAWLANVLFFALGTVMYLRTPT